MTAVVILTGAVGLTGAMGGPPGAGFTYQGQLKRGGAPVNGLYDFEFRLFTLGADGMQQGETILKDNLAVANGLFTVALDFGDVFDGNLLWLEVRVRDGADTGAFTLLTPRQELTASPYSSTAARIALPYADSVTFNGAGVAITNGDPNGKAIAGYSSAQGLQEPAPAGVYGQSIADNGRGVMGVATTDENGVGVFGEGYTGVRGQSSAADGYGVYGQGYLGGYFESLSAGGSGLEATGPVSGVYGHSHSGDGVEGRSAIGYGVRGYSTSESGVYGASAGGRGVSGNGRIGVEGLSEAPGGTGVFGEAGNGASASGVRGTSTAGHGVFGRSTSGLGVAGTSSTFYGVYGRHADVSNVDLTGFGKSGVWGDSLTGNGVLGTTGAAGGGGVVGMAARSDNYGVYGSNTAGTAIFARSDGGGASAGLYGHSTGSQGNGVIGECNNGISAYGVWGRSTQGIGVYGSTSTGWAGYFSGPLHATSASATVKAFRIDHPLDPENKFLEHSSVESPDMKNVYDGVVTLDPNGQAWIGLPDYFETLNRDFRYQLTAIGGPAPNLHISQKISDNGFRIAGGTPGMEVSWQVTGIRQDPAANYYRVKVESAKPAAERGKYLVPEAYGRSNEHTINHRWQASAMER
jgi:hypothetical protein